MTRFVLSTIMIMSALLCHAQLSKYDLNRPFGWATCSSMTSGDDYDLCGGDGGEIIKLTSNGGDMRNLIWDAVNNYDIVILDGAEGDFIVSASISFKNLKNKTIVGVNNARLCTQFFVTDEMKAALDEVGVNNMSSNGGGGTLSNGQKVAEDGEYYTRMTLMELLDDHNETYRNAGLFSLSGCENIIIRNLDLVGPGPVDVGGADLVTVINGTNHLWIDHCNFTDGMDGNLDITVKSDFVTVSWCTFAYTERAYAHQFSNLIGGSEDASTQGRDNLNVTWANNIWGAGCKNRMPMARFGTIHVFNNYYCCVGNSAGINARIDSEVLIEHNYFGEGVKKIFSQSDAKAYSFKGNIYKEPFSEPVSGKVNVPYEYTLYAADEVLDITSSKVNGTGATLTYPLLIGADPSSDTSLSSLTVNGVEATQVTAYEYSYRLPLKATAINVIATPYNSKATVSNMSVPSIDELPADATFTVTAENGTTANFTLHLTPSNSQFKEGKEWDFKTWGATSIEMMSNNEVWNAMGDGRFETSFSEATELGFEETESITVSGTIRINPSRSTSGYLQGGFTMYIPVIEGQTLTFTYSHTSNSKGTRYLLVNNESIGSTSSTTPTTATYTVPTDVTSIRVNGGDGLRYYMIEMSAAPESSIVSEHLDNDFCINGNIVRCAGNHPIEVFNMLGARIAKGHKQLSVENLPHDIYIVRCGAQVRRISTHR